MIHIQLICVGKLKEPFFIAAAEEYQKRLTPYCKFSLTQLPEERLPDSPSAALIEEALRKEGEAILQKLPKSGTLVALCVEGKPLSSEGLSAKMGAWMQTSSSLTFVIGGSHGLSDHVKAKADLRLSLSSMTLPHHLARVVVLEQVYRGFKIMEGSGYHK